MTQTSGRATITLEVTHASLPPGPIDGFRFMWAYYVKGYDPSKHCQPCFKGSRVREFATPTARSGATYALDRMDEFEYVYICGVGSGPKAMLHKQNLHFPLRCKQGSDVTAETYNGYVFTAHNAERVDIPALRDGWNGLDREHTRCKNFQFAVSVFGDTTQEMLDRAIAIATDAHAGQKDRAGQDYISHPLTVMGLVEAIDEKIVAVLHDVIEDTPLTEDDLRKEGFSEGVISGVLSVTRRKDEFDYFDFVARSSMHPVGRNVKRADLQHNMDLTRIANPTQRDFDRIERYKTALWILDGRADQRALRRIQLLPDGNNVSAETLLAMPGDKRVFACDFHIENIERRAKASPGGFEMGRLINIDHHADVPEMTRTVSSANLALEYVAANGLPREDDYIVAINHIDCDSILTAGIMSGALQPEALFGEAAIAADHTGAPNDIADLLQGIDAASRAGPRTIYRSFEALFRHLDGEPPSDFAAQALDKRLQKRRDAADRVANGAFTAIDGVHFATTEAPIDGEFFPSLLPEATVIVVANPFADKEGYWQVKVRLGLAAQGRFTLHTLNIPEFDPAYGGRWNAGSNRRGGGATIEPADYAAKIAERIRRA